MTSPTFGLRKKRSRQQLRLADMDIGLRGGAVSIKIRQGKRVFETWTRKSEYLFLIVAGTGAPRGNQTMSETNGYSLEERGTADV